MIEYEVELRTDIGTRQEQQDYADVYKDNGMVFAVLCDGMGGHRMGGLASSIAVDSIIRAYSAQYPGGEYQELVENAMKDADDRISALIDREGAPLLAGTTASLILIRSKAVYWASVGDSRAYLFRDGQFAQLTKDQTYQTVLDEQLHAGLINEELYKAEQPNGHKLINYLGIGGLSLIDYNASPLSLHSGDYILVTSDGLYKYLPIDKIAVTIFNCRSIVECLDQLNSGVDEIAKRTGRKRDNLTAILIRIK